MNSVPHAASCISKKSKYEVQNLRTVLALFMAFTLYLKVRTFSGTQNLMLYGQIETVQIYSRKSAPEFVPDQIFAPDKCFQTRSVVPQFRLYHRLSIDHHQY